MSVAAQAAPLSYHPITPCRILDTRNAGGGGAIGAGATKTYLAHATNFSVQGGSASDCGLPSSFQATDTLGNKQNRVKAIAVNVTVTAGTGSGYMYGFPSNGAAVSSVINFNSGVTIANMVILQICDEIGPAPCSSGDISFKMSPSASRQVILDVLGYFTEPELGQVYTGTISGLGGVTASLEARSSGDSTAAASVSTFLMPINTNGCKAHRLHVQTSGSIGAGNTITFSVAGVSCTVDGDLGTSCASDADQYGDIAGGDPMVMNISQTGNPVAVSALYSWQCVEN